MDLVKELLKKEETILEKNLIIEAQRQGLESMQMMLEAARAMLNMRHHAEKGVPIFSSRN